MEPAAQELSGSKDEGLDAVRAAFTNGVNYHVSHRDVLARLAEWRSRFSFTVTYASRSTLHINLHTLPEDLDAFARELYEFCPDILEQGYEELAWEWLQKQRAGLLTEGEAAFADGIDLADESTRGLKLLRRGIEQNHSIALWWD